MAALSRLAFALPAAWLTVSCARTWSEDEAASPPPDSREANDAGHHTEPAEPNDSGKDVAPVQTVDSGNQAEPVQTVDSDNQAVPGHPDGGSSQAHPDCADPSLPNSECPTCIETTLPGQPRYAFCPRTVGWQEASDDCVKRGGALASIHDAQQALALRDYAFNLGWLIWWIGLTDQANPGSFTWSDDSPLDFEAWAAGEPSSEEGSEHCVIMRDDTLWEDFPCRVSIHYVCQLP